MKCFVAYLTEGRHINVPADRIDLRDDAILAYDGDKLVSIVDIGVVISAHISEKAPTAPTSPAQEQEAPQAPTLSKDPKPPQEQRHEPTEAAYKGFLYIKCEKCGSVKGFFTRTPIKKNRCRCGHETELRGLKPLYVNCKCGANFKYQTNLTDNVASIDCINCGSPVDLEYHDKKGVYSTIGFQKGY